MIRKMLHRGVIPGFGLTLGFTMFYLSAIVLIPLSTLVGKSIQMGVSSFWKTISDPRVLASCRLSFTTSLLAALVNLFFGFIVAWVLVRYEFRGKRLMDAMVDLPFALPTAVSGITLTALYTPDGWFGHLLNRVGIQVAFQPLGIVIALIFIGLPFVVRTVQPSLEDLDREMEEAATSLGATRFQTFWRVLLPSIVPALLTGFATAFARGIGEYGSVVFISGNLPMKTEITPLLIVTKLEQHDTAGACAIAIVMLTISFCMLLFINGIQWWRRRKQNI